MIEILLSFGLLNFLSEICVQGLKFGLVFDTITNIILYEKVFTSRNKRLRYDIVMHHFFFKKWKNYSLDFLEKLRGKLNHIILTTSAYASNYFTQKPMDKLI